MTNGRQPPSPDGWPVIGHTLQYVRDPFGRMETWSNLGDVVQLRFPTHSPYLVTHPELIEDVLVSGPEQYERGELVRRAFGPLRRNALSAAEGESWRRLRRQFQPAFTHERIDTYAEQVVQHAAEQTSGWDDGQEVDIEAEMRQLTLRVLAESLFGIDVREEGAVRTLAAAISKRSDFTSPTPFVPDWVPTPANRRFKRALGVLRDQVEDRIARCEVTHDSGDDFLSQLLSMQDDDSDLTEAEIRDNVIGFLWAGQDTTALALTFTWYLLATHPEKRERLEDELATVLDGALPRRSDLADFRYLDNVLTETLRLYPPGPTTLREPIESVTVGGHEIPAGSPIILPQWVVHRDERWYDDPETFRPERWTEPFESDLPEYAYFPFGGGPRHCIGMKFAWMEMRLSVATIASRVRLKSLVQEPLSFALSATLKPKGELRMRVRKYGRH